MIPRISFFSHPKPWRSEFAALQTVAVESWLKLSPDVTLLGDDEGTALASSRLRTKHHPSIETNEWGTPLVSDIFKTIQRDAVGDVICYINADIVLGWDFLATVSALSGVVGSKWLAVGGRSDLELSPGTPIEEQLGGPTKPHGPGGIDYFVFPAGEQMFPSVHPFALGKFVWDQWLVGNAHRRGLPVIDCTQTISAVHLNAPWFFRGHPETSRSAIEASEESQQNCNFDYYRRTIADGATHVTCFGPAHFVEVRYFNNR